MVSGQLADGGLAVAAQRTPTPSISGIHTLQGRMRQGRACQCAALGNAQTPDQKLSFTAKLSRLLEALVQNVLDEAGGAGGQESWLALPSSLALSRAKRGTLARTGSCTSVHPSMIW